MKNTDLTTSTSIFRIGKGEYFAVIALLVAVLGVFGFLAKWGLFKPQNTELLNGSFLPQPRLITEFDLISEAGTPLTLADFKGHWTVVFAGYSYCPELCPTTLAKLKATKAQLGVEAKQLTVLFLSVDPEHDTPGQLATYIHHFDPDFRAATGSAKQIERLAANLGLLVVKVPNTNNLVLAIEHSARLVLVNPEGKMAAYLLPPLTVETLVSDFKTVLKTK